MLIVKLKQLHPTKSEVSNNLENYKGLINEHVKFEEIRQKSKDDFQSHTYDEKGFKETRKISNFHQVDK